MAVDATTRREEPGRRIAALDSLRGLAAVSVVVDHFAGALRWSPKPLWLLLFPPGHAAVVLFFVLSGHVLAIPVWRGRQPAYRIYAVRRFFRIYVPYAGAVLLAAAGAMTMNGAQLPYSAWFYRTWHTAVTLRLVGAQLLTMSTSPALNTALWSLRYEVEMSAIFPVVCWLVVRLRFWGTLLLSIVLALAAERTILFHPGGGAAYELGVTAFCGSCFFLGALTSWRSAEIGAILARAGWVWKGLLGVSAWAAYEFGPDVLVALAATLILILVEHGGLRRWLETPLLEYVGRISYSLYLTHGTVLFACLIGLYGRLPLWGIGVVYFMVAPVMAHLFCVTVEEPSMRLGRRLTVKGGEGDAGVRFPFSGV